MNYFRPPEDIFDDEESLLLWGRRALEAALRARKLVPEPAAGKAGKTAVRKVAVEKTDTPKVIARRHAGKAGSGTSHE